MRSYLDARTGLSVPQRFTLADILLYCFIVFGNDRGDQPLPSDHANLQAWLARVGERAGAKA